MVNFTLNLVNQVESEPIYISVIEFPISHKLVYDFLLTSFE